MNVPMDEREVKLSVADDADALDPAVLFEGLGRWTDDTVDQHAVYFDTDDLRLTRAGASLRFRSDDGWTVKTPVATDGDEVVRHEHRFAGGPGRPPVGATDLVLGWTRGAPVDEVATVHTRRRRLRLFAGEDGPELEVVDDTVHTEATSAPPGTFREVEVELGADGHRRTYERVVLRLRASGATSGAGPSKVAHALGARASAAADVPDPGDLDRRAGLDALVQHAVAASVHRLVHHDHLVRIGADPEGVHQARVATRRLRSDLRTFRPLLDAGWVDALRDELQWLGTELGRVRDADVLLERLEARVATLPEPERASAEMLVAARRDARTRERGALLDAMTSPRYLALLDRLVDAARAPRGLDAHLSHPRRRARRLAARPWKKLRRTVRVLPHDPTDEQLHEVRKRAKHARYACEAVAPVSPRRVARLATRISDLQDVLGEQHDAIGAAEWLRDAAADHDEPGAAFAAGLLAGGFLHDAAARRTAWRRPWRRARRLAADVF